ncbi:MAG: hypothetical protein JO057_11215 [Chloroflexi bacterium]|nr:hypothetical protein [Chloroflexota bacterium]
MPEVLAIVVLAVALAAGVWLSVNLQTQLRQLRAELDQTQAQLNDTLRRVSAVEQQVTDLKATTVAPPPRLPRNRSSELDDLREQLRAAHRTDPESDD